MMDGYANNPSLVAWVCEGSFDFAQVLCQNFEHDPLERLVVGTDIVGFTLASGPLSGEYRPPPYWIIEITYEEEELVSKPLARATVEAMDRGVVGVVIPTVKEERQTVDAWRQDWFAVSQALDVEPLDMEGRRSRSRVRLRGLKAGELVWLETPWGLRRGTMADHAGIAELEIWHQGEARLRVGNETRTLQLVPDRWQAGDRIFEGLTLDW